MTNLTGMFQQLNDTIKETPLASRGPGTPAGMPYNPMDNVNPMMQQFAQGVGNMAGFDPAANRTSAQNMTISNAEAGSAMESQDPQMLLKAASLMMQQGRISEAQQLTKRAEEIKSLRKLRAEEDALAAEEAAIKAKEMKTLQNTILAAKNAKHPKWALDLENGTATVADYMKFVTGKRTNDYEEKSKRQTNLLKANAEGRNKKDPARAPLSSGVVNLTNDAFQASYEAQTTADHNRATIRKLDRLVSSGEVIPSGNASAGWEAIKKALGTEDEVTAIREQFNLARTKQAMDNLPPGTASEKDVELVMKGVPSENASFETIRNFLEASARVEEAAAMYYEMKGEWWTENGNGAGLKQAFKDRRAQMNGGSGNASGAKKILTVEERDAELAERAELGIIATGQGEQQK